MEKLDKSILGCYNLFTKILIFVLQMLTLLIFIYKITLKKMIKIEIYHLFF